MKLSCRFLTNVANVNSFQYLTQFEAQEGFAGDIYFQIIDATVDRSDQGFSPPGRRYVPSAGATLTVKFDNINDAKVVSRVATNPFPNDLSIWKVSVLASDPIVGTVTMALTLNEGGVVSSGFINGALRVQSNSTFCG